MKRKIVVAGCSFATHYARSKGLKQFPIWPELLAKELKLKLINTAEMGASNTEIYSKAIDAAVTYNDIELMVVMWSEWDRLSFPHEKPWKSFSPETTFKTNVENFPGCQDICKVMHDNDLSNLSGVVNSTIRLIWSFQTIMESMGIKYVHIQGPSPNIYEWYKVWKFADRISQSPYIDLIKNNFVGWPPVRYNAGWNMDDFFRFHLEDPLETFTIAGDEDSHPNELGNQYIYNILKNHYEEIYQTN